MVEDGTELYRRGRERYDAGEFGAAADLLARSAAADPHFKAFELRGECLLRLGRLREAVEPLAAATALNAQGRAPALLAEAFLGLGDYERAVEFADEALRRAPGHRGALRVREAALPHLRGEA